MKIVASSIALTALFAAQAQAADAQFKNHLKSDAIVSPAQLYQVRASKSDFQLGFQNASMETKAKGAAADKDTMTANSLFAAGIYSMDAFRAGLSLDYVSSNLETKSAEGKGKADSSDMMLTPQAAYTTGPISAGLAIDVVQSTMKPKGEGAVEAKGNFTRPRVGVTYAQDALEAGLAYNSQVKVNDKLDHTNPDNAKKLTLMAPAEIVLHGRTAVTETMAAGAVFTNRGYKALAEKALKDQNEIKGTWEMTAGATKVEAALAYMTAYYKNKEFISNENVASYKVGAGADYAVTEMAEVGAALEHETGSEKAKGTTYSKNNTNFALRGNVRF